MQLFSMTEQCSLGLHHLTRYTELSYALLN